MIDNLLITIDDLENNITISTNKITIMRKFNEKLDTIINQVWWKKVKSYSNNNLLSISWK